MITHSTADDLFKIELEDIHDFTIYSKALGDAEYINVNRGELIELRHIIDQALNTSVEELGDVE